MVLPSSRLARSSWAVFTVLGLVALLLGTPAAAAPGDDTIALSGSVRSTADLDGDGDPGEVDPGAVLDWAVDYQSVAGGETGTVLTAQLTGGQHLTQALTSDIGWTFEYSADNGLTWTASWNDATSVRATIPQMMAPDVALGSVSYTSSTPVLQPQGLISQGANGGDGWVPIVAGSKLYAVTHHSSPPQMSCIDMAAGGAACPGFPRQYPYPSSNTGNSATVIGTELWFSYQSGSGAIGFLCWDTVTDVGCGDFPLGPVLPISGGQSDSISRAASVGTRAWFTSSDGNLWCFETTTRTLCPGAPYVSGLGTYGQYPADIEVVGTRIFVSRSDSGFSVNYPAGTNIVTCFDTTTDAACTGWTAARSVTGVGIFARPNAAGIVDGICSRGPTMQCYDLDGSNPVTIADASLQAPYTYPSLVDARVGSRIIAGDFPNNQVLCYDFATGPCGPMPVGTNFYGTQVLSGTCVIGLGDPGMYASINAMTGTSPCHQSIAGARKLIRRSSLQCEGGGSVPMTWHSVRLTDVDLTPGVEFSSLTLEVRDAAGTTLSGPTEMTGTSGVAFLSGHGDAMEFVVSGIPASTAAWDDGVPPHMVVDFDGPPAQLCLQTAVSLLCHQLAPTVGVVATGSLGPSTTSQSFSVYRPPTCDASISGLVYADDDQNGVRDPGEHGIGGLFVYIYPTDTWTQQVVPTAADGSWSFPAIGDQQYYVFVDFGAFGSYQVTRSPGAGPADSWAYLTAPAGTALTDRDWGVAYRPQVDLTVSTVPQSAAPGTVVGLPFVLGDRAEGSIAQTFTIEIPVATSFVAGALPAGCTVVTATTATCAIGPFLGWSQNIHQVVIPVLLSAAAVPGDVLAGTATISADSLAAVELNPIDNTASLALSVAPRRADLSVSTVGFSSKPGPTSVTVRVDNAGPSDVDDAQVEAVAPSGTTFDTGTLPAGCTASSATTVVCNLATIAPAGSATVTLPVLVAPGTPVGARPDGSAAVRSGATDPVAANDTAPVHGTVLALEVDVDVTAMSSVTGLPGDAVTVQVDVVNHGPDASASGATVVVTAPTGVVFDLAHLPAGCIAGPATSVTCSTGALGIGAGTSFAIPATIAADATAGTFTDGRAVASVDAATEVDVDPGNDANTGDVVITPQVDLHVAATPVRIRPGGAASTTLTVVNEGRDAAIGSTVTMTAPAGTTVDAASLPAACSAPTATTVLCAVGALAPGDADRFDIVLVVPAATPFGALPAGTATATPASGAIDTDPSDDQAAVPATVVRSFDLAITTPDLQVPAGADRVVDLLVVNHGPDAAPAAAVDLALPAGITLGPAGLPAGCAAATPTTVHCTLGDLAAADARTISVPVHVAASAGASLTLPAGRATVTSSDEPAEITLANNAVDVRVEVIEVRDPDIGEPRVEVSFTVPTEITPGVPFDGTVTVANTGTGASTAFTITLHLPPGVGVDPARLDELAAHHCRVLDASTIACDVAALDAGATLSWPIPLLIAPGLTDVGPVTVTVNGRTPSSLSTATPVVTLTLGGHRTVATLAFTGTRLALLASLAVGAIGTGTLLRARADRLRRPVR